MIDQPEFQTHTERISGLVDRVNTRLEGEARSTALELLQSVMDLHGSVMAHIVEVLKASGESGRAALAKLGSDPMVCGLLVLYGVHPLDLQARVAAAMERIRPQLRKQGGTVELLGFSDGAVRLKLQTSGHGCGSGADALKQVVEQAIREVAPEVEEISVEGPAAPVSGFVPLSTLRPLNEEEKSYEESAA